MATIPLIVCAVLSVQMICANAQANNRTQLLSTLRVRATQLETTLKREEAIYQQRQREVPALLREYGTKESTCYKRLNVATEILKPANDTICVVPKMIRSCTDWFRAGYKTDGEYTIDPDGPGGVMAFPVDCQFSTPTNLKDTRIWTIIHHDSEKRQDVGKCKDPLCFKKPISYTIPMDQIAALVSISNNCDQEVSYDCYGSRLLAGGYGAWYNRDGVKMNHWAHSNAQNPGKCWCGMHNKCSKPSTTCYCDNATYSWKNDRGWFKKSSKDLLPVTKLAFGDTAGAKQKAYFYLGPLKCLGK